jgi:hypothetical protein
VKTFDVSVYVRAFASITVEAENEEQAKRMALESEGSQLSVQGHTIEVGNIESISEVNP